MQNMPLRSQMRLHVNFMGEAMSRKALNIYLVSIINSTTAMKKSQIHASKIYTA